jgi:DNA-binding CsgD family transcriptional regulator
VFFYIGFATILAIPLNRGISDAEVRPTAVQDVRDAYRLIVECRDLGSDPALWQMRMLAGVCQIIGAPTGSCGEGFWARPVHPIQPLSFFDVGFAARHRELFMGYLREIGPQRDAIFRALADVPGPVLTRTRSAAVSDTVWYRSADFNNYRKPAGIDHCLVSVCQVSDEGAIAAIALARGLRERDFSRGEVRLLEFFHGELRRLVGRQLVSATEASPEKLSPRLRQTLACLVEGDSEKQAAARLGLSPTTMHQYVTMLYRRFGVRSRGQLLAHVLRRSGRGGWSRTLRVTSSAP